MFGRPDTDGGCDWVAQRQPKRRSTCPRSRQGRRRSRARPASISRAVRTPREQIPPDMAAAKTFEALTKDREAMDSTGFSLAQPFRVLTGRCQRRFVDYQRLGETAARVFLWTTRAMIPCGRLGRGWVLLRRAIASQTLQRRPLGCAPPVASGDRDRRCCCRATELTCSTPRTSVFVSRPLALPSSAVMDVQNSALTNGSKAAMQPSAVRLLMKERWSLFVMCTESKVRQALRAISPCRAAPKLWLPAGNALSLQRPPPGGGRPGFRKSVQR